MTGLERITSLPDVARCHCGAVELAPGEFPRCVDCELHGEDTPVCGDCQFSYDGDPWGETTVCHRCQDEREDKAGNGSDLANAHSGAESEAQRAIREVGSR